MSDKPIRKILTNNSRALVDVQAFHQSIEKLILDGYRIVKNTKMDDFCRAWPQQRVVLYLEGHDPYDIKKAEEEKAKEPVKPEAEEEEVPSEEVQVEEIKEEAVSKEEPKKAPARRGRKAKTK